MATNNLTYFTVTGHWYDVEAPDPAGSTNTPQFNVVSAFVTFTARLAPGTSLRVATVALPDSTTANTDVSIAPIVARILAGELQTIDRTNTPGAQLLANTAILGLTAPLIYDVAFTAVTYAGANRKLDNFAFTAPTTNTPIDLTDPTFTRLDYNPTGYTT